MKYTPKEEKDINRGFSPLPHGNYPFTVLESDVQLSKSAKNAGKEMMKLKINVHGADFDKHVYDYCADWFSEWKFKHFFDAVGLSQKYAEGRVDPSNNAYEGKQGYVKIGIEVNKETGEERNKVDDYIVPATAEKPKPTTTTQQKTSESRPKEDEIIMSPFDRFDILC